jgi:hypothetical protein
VGYEGSPEAGLEFWGGSFVADPFGVVLAEGSHGNEEIVLADCDPRKIDEIRRYWAFFRDRRIDAYGPLLQRVIVDWGRQPPPCLHDPSPKFSTKTAGPFRLYRRTQLLEESKCVCFSVLVS